MDLLFSILGNAFNAMPDLAAVGLAVGGFLLALMPKSAADIEQNRTARLVIGSFAVVFGVLGFWSSHKQKDAADSQMGSLLAAAKISATHDDISSLRDDINAGFDRVAKAIASQPTPGNTEKPPPIDKPQPAIKLQEIQLSPAIVRHVQVTQQRTASNNPEDRVPASGVRV